MIPATITVGTRAEYARWIARWRRFLTARGLSADTVSQIDARYNFRENRITLYRLAEPRDERSVSDTLAHESLHALLLQLDEPWAARAIDLVAKPPGNPGRIGGL